VCFTSGGTEADTWALTGIARLRGAGRIVTTAIEHAAVWRTCEYLAGQGYEVVSVPVDGRGVVDLEAMARAIAGGAALVSAMHANNETGVLQPVAAIGRLARQQGVPFHVDAVQSFGRVPVRVDELGADLLSVSAHKLGGPRGIGALYIRPGTTLAPLIHGGPQEGGRRGGTENVAGIVGFGRACGLAAAGLDPEAARLSALRDRLEAGVLSALDRVRVNGPPAARLPNTASLCLTGAGSEAVLLGLDLAGVAASAGSACTSGEGTPSRVLLAMGLAPRLAASAMRFSLGWTTAAADVDYALEVLPGIVRRLRAASAI
jgi:cysteine desulfurase